MRLFTVESSKGKKRRNILSTLLIGLVIVLLLLVSCTTKSTPEAVSTSLSTPSPSLTATCPNTNQLSTPGQQPPTKMVVILYDPHVEMNSALELTDGKKVTDIPNFVSSLIPDLVGPGDEISVFQLGYDNYPAARVTRQYSYLTTYPQLYVAPSLVTLTPLPPTSIPTPGFEEVATNNAFREMSTQRAYTETASVANYNCEVAYYNANLQSTATSWRQTEVSDVDTISTAAIADFSTVTPSKNINSELTYGGLYYGLYFASVDLQSDCSKYDECDVVIVDDLHVYGKHNPENLAINLKGVNVYVIMPDCRDINQPDCTTLQSYWTSEFQNFGVTKIMYWNGARVEQNLLGELGK